MLLQERNELLFKTALAMMLRLRTNVRNRMCFLRNANRKRAVSLLPREISRVLLIHPSRRRTFDQLHCLRQRHVRGQRQQNMSVILRAACNERLKSVLVGNATKECLKIRLNLRPNQIPAILRREYAMDEIRNVGVRHRYNVKESWRRRNK